MICLTHLRKSMLNPHNFMRNYDQAFKTKSLAPIAQFLWLDNNKQGER